MPLYTETTLIGSDPAPELDNPTIRFGASDIALTIDDGVIVEAADNFAVFSDGDAIELPGLSGSELINNGNIFSLLDAVHFKSDHGSIVNNEGRNIIGLRTGIDFYGDDETVTNHGTIAGFQHYGIRLADDSGNALIDNYGDIFGRLAGIYTFSQNAGGTINNHGIIRGEGFGIDIGTVGGNVTVIFNAPGALIKGGGGALTHAINVDTDGRLHLDNRGTVDGNIRCNKEDDVVISSGKIIGDVSLGSGNDVFRGIGSSTSGFVFGESGNDLLISGNAGDTLNGGSDVDTLRGGRGRDFLTGGAEQDFFDFNSVKDSVIGSNRDRILDFNHGEADKIDLKTIDAKTGVGGNQAFKFIGKQGFHDVKGELRYEDKGATCIVQGDRNGDGKADFEIFVAVGSLLKGDFLL